RVEAAHVEPEREGPGTRGLRAVHEDLDVAREARRVAGEPAAGDAAIEPARRMELARHVLEAELGLSCGQLVAEMALAALADEVVERDLGEVRLEADVRRGGDLPRA